jgi:hypothetical protein
MQASAAEELARSMFHLANANATPLIFTETLFVVIDGGTPSSSTQPAFQIQMCRVMVLHPLIDSNSNRIPSKQT